MNTKDYWNRITSVGSYLDGSSYWDEMVAKLLEEYKEWIDEPLDGDEVDAFIKIISAKANLIEWNITKREYDLLLW